MTIQEIPPIKTRRQLIQGVAAASVLSLSPMFARAQTRVETLRIIVGFPPGGTTDAFARRVGKKMRGTYSNTVLIDNKPGAGGQLGVMTLKSAASDGAHILYSPASMMTIYPHSYSRLGYAVSDVEPIGIGHSTDHAFVVGPVVPDSVKNVRDFVEWAKVNPGKASIGDPAAGSMPHLLAGQLVGMSSPLGDWVQHHKGGKARILATSGPDRSPYTPDVATYREQGFGELMVREWFGFFAPAAVSEANREALNSALRSAMNQPDIRRFLTPLAAYLEASTIVDHNRRLAADSEMARRLVSALGFKADS